MQKPDDIPQDVWDAAASLWTRERVARAIMAERARKTDDIPKDIWDAATKANNERQLYAGDHDLVPFDIEVIARALYAERDENSFTVDASAYDGIPQGVWDAVKGWTDWYAETPASTVEEAMAYAIIAEREACAVLAETYKSGMTAAIAAAIRNRGTAT